MFNIEKKKQKKKHFIDENIFLFETYWFVENTIED